VDDNASAAQTAQAVIVDGMPVAAFDIDEGVFVYHTQPKIFALDELQEIADLFNGTRSEIIDSFTIGSALASIRERIIVDEISYMKNGSNTITFVLLRQKPELMKLSPTGS
jgi:hypothetical protein